MLEKILSWKHHLLWGKEFISISVYFGFPQLTQGNIHGNHASYISKMIIPSTLCFVSTASIFFPFGFLVLTNYSRSYPLLLIYLENWRPSSHLIQELRQQMRVTGAQAFRPSSSDFSGTLAQRWINVEQPGHELIVVA